MHLFEFPDAGGWRPCRRRNSDATIPASFHIARSVTHIKTSSRSRENSSMTSSIRRSFTGPEAAPVLMTSKYSSSQFESVTRVLCSPLPVTKPTHELFCFQYRKESQRCHRMEPAIYREEPRISRARSNLPSACQQQSDRPLFGWSKGCDNFFIRQLPFRQGFDRLPESGDTKRQRIPDRAIQIEKDRLHPCAVAESPSCRCRSNSSRRHRALIEKAKTRSSLRGHLTPSIGAAAQSAAPDRKDSYSQLRLARALSWACRQ